MSPISSDMTVTGPLDGMRRRLTPKFQVFWADKGIPKSPLHHLLKSNVPPSESEIVTIRALITDAEVRIEELHHRFPTRSDASQRTESKLLKFIEAHKALLSPVRHLPTEILQEIFLCYRGNGNSNPPLAMVPWRLGHISHRWRRIALSLPSLWDDIPGIDISSSSHAKRSCIRALTYLIRRSGTSPTLKLRIYYSSLNPKIIGFPIIKEVILHSERIQYLSMSISNLHATTREFRGLKGRLPNLRVLTLDFHSVSLNDGLNLDIFEIAPALRRVMLIGSSYAGYSNKFLLPWSQVTHFHDTLRSERVAPYVALSLLPSLTYLYIDKTLFDGLTPALPSHYGPITLPHLRTLQIHTRFKEGDAGAFLESLTVPSVELIKISDPRSLKNSKLGSLIPRLASMLSRSDEPSRLQKLAFRTNPLQAGALSALLNLTPQLIELDIVVPPMYDILILTHGEGEVTLVPMLRALYIHECELVGRAQTECFNDLAQARCELDSLNDSEDTMALSPKNRSTMEMLRIVFNSAKNRDVSQVIFNDWSSRPPSREESEAVEMLTHWSRRLRRTSKRSKDNNISIPNREHNYLEMLNQLFACVKQCEAITASVLHKTQIHIDLRRIIVADGILGQDNDDLKRRAIDILNRWDELLLNNIDDYCWAGTSPQWPRDHSLVYVPRKKRHALRMSGDALSIVYGLKLEGPFEETLWQNAYYYGERND